MEKFLTILLLLLTIQTFGQRQITFSDSISLSQTWSKLVKYLSSKNFAEIKNTSFKKINCLWCLTEKQMQDANLDDSVPIDTFILRIYELIPSSKMWTVIKSDEKPKFWKLESKNDTVYEVVIHTFKKNELGKGHEGGQHLFQFKKNDGAFKLSGFTSVP